MKKVVKVIGVEHNVTKEKRDGGTYNCTIFRYQDDRGEQSKPFATSFLDKAASLKAALDSLEAGSNAEITLEKKGMFWNITHVASSTEAVGTTKKTGGGSSYKGGAKSSFDAHGMQIGNALNVAAATLGPKSSIAALKDRAYEVLDLSAEMRVYLSNGTQKGAVGADIKVGGTSSDEVDDALSKLVDDDINFDD